MRIQFFFHAYTQNQAHPITVWAEASNMMAARTAIQRENPFVIRLIFVRSKRIE